MELNIKHFIKKHPTLYILAKYNSFKLLKMYNAIKNLDLIIIDAYKRTHDLNNNKMDSILHFILKGNKEDSFELKKQYTDPIFDLDFYKDNYIENSDDCIIDYCLNGFYKGYKINFFDHGYITNLKEPARNQYSNTRDKIIQKEIDKNYYITNKNIIIPYIQSEKTFSMNTIKVGVFVNDPFSNITACPYLRIHEPFSKLSKSKKFHFFVYGMDSYQFIDWDNIIKSKVFDIVVVERIIPFLDDLLKSCLNQNVKMIYETDDDLLAIDESNSSFEYINSCRNEISNYINNSDTIVVTTPALAQKFDKNKVEVIRNYYIDSLLDLKKFRKNNTNTIKIGYFGTLTHSNDINIIKKVIIKLQEEMLSKHNITLEFIVVGGFDDLDHDESWISTIDLPKNSWDFKFFMNWLGNIVDWDVGIAPLENSSFNKGKSELKYIEYSALAIPVVCSDIEPYNTVVKDGITGFLANTEEEWFEKLKKLILNENLREEIVTNSQKDILENYSLNDRVEKWEKILENLVK
ncbi:glycosyltransferase [Methanobrevibacter sp. OttesenSCG-928-K11]|nr:glycosyltransferase [Methanobrevibacter sp. OttesenSCG-928-K11]MDL2271092.1 glycosyltransferase [Methanobrevibacter sp. OttesenSCG-928-I08]